MLKPTRRSGGLAARWRQMSNMGKALVISISVLFVLAIVWSSGRVDVESVRNKLSKVHTSDGTSDEPTQNTQDETPIIDGVPNDEKDKPIEDPASENATDKETTPAVENTEPTHAHPSPIAGGIPLRIMFIGASVTLGDPPQSAYRQQLREWLVGLGNPVNLVGERRFGNFKDNDVQAFPATPVKVLHEKAMKAVPAMQPNLVIINAGSSDCFQITKYGSEHALSETRKLVDFVFKSAPGTTVILSTLVMSTNPRTEECIKSFNAQIRQVAHDLKREGKALVLSEQHYDQGMPGRVTAKTLKSDQMHPTFEGWELMGEIFKQSIREADAEGFILRAIENGIWEDGDAEKDMEENKAKELDSIKEKAAGLGKDHIVSRRTSESEPLHAEPRDAPRRRHRRAHGRMRR